MRKCRWAVLLFILLVRPVWSFSFTEDFNKGFYWASFPLATKNHVTVESDGPELAALVEQAKQAWEDVAGRELWSFSQSFLITGSTSGNNVRWSFNFGAETGFSPQSTLAVTVRHSSGTHMNRFEIILNGENQALKNNQGGMLFQVLLHEFGHVIGLDHTNSTAAVMQANLSRQNILQADDQAGALAIVGEHLHRQAIGFTSPFSQENESNGQKIAACGSVSLITDRNDQDPPNGSFFLSLLFGVIGALIFRRGVEISASALARTI
jgi:hypothetical protein